MILLGAAGGDIAGSRFEWDNYRSKDFELFADNCFFTDDTVMTMAIAQALLYTESLEELPSVAAQSMQKFGRAFPGRGYGGHFGVWLQEADPKPYNSYGNGSAMRVSACGWAADSLEKAGELAEAVSIPTHNHPEGVKGAKAVAEAVWMARKGEKIDAIRKYLERYYVIDFTLDEIRSTYRFNETCQETVPQALEAFYESNSYEDALRCAISVGGDSDTLAAITGSIAEAYFGIPDDMQEKIMSYFTGEHADLLTDTVDEFSSIYEPDA